MYYPAAGITRDALSVKLNKEKIKSTDISS